MNSYPPEFSRAGRILICKMFVLSLTVLCFKLMLQYQICQLDHQENKKEVLKATDILRFQQQRILSHSSSPLQKET